jgi:E3 ubiquitin-protein ligase RNF115/126
MSGVFQQNYLSNFGNRMFLNDIARFLAMAQRGKNPHPPASQEALNKLKRFPLIERFCQKKDGKMELPNCCICQNEIELGKETVLLPCGHMYHWECCLKWLQTNNTCPICRFEIK